MDSPFSLRNKTILVTGASSGIGQATAIECSKLGACLIVIGRDESRLNKTYSLLNENVENRAFRIDLTDKESVATIIKEMPLIDGIVHCAGITKIKPFQFTTSDDFESVMNINFYAPLELTQLLIKNKKITKGGSIVFASSISGVYCSAFASSIYSSSKGAINGLIKGMALDLSVKQIRVNSVTPGMIDTNIMETTEITHEQLADDIKKYPLKRYGKPEEVAYAIIYLLSDASSWVTGTNLLIDGGYTLL